MVVALSASSLLAVWHISMKYADNRSAAQKYTRHCALLYYDPLLSIPVQVCINKSSATFDPILPIPAPALSVFTGIRARSQHVKHICTYTASPITKNNGMRAIAISLFLAAPAFGSAATAPLRKRIGGFATYYYTQTGNAYVCS